MERDHRKKTDRDRERKSERERERCMHMYYAA